MRTVITLCLYIASFVILPGQDQRLSFERQDILDLVNAIRSEGCQCGDDYMPPVPALSWDETLERTALEHAREMEKFNFFSHRSRDGADVGERLDARGYRWQYAGENLAEGQKSFRETLNDWIESPTHCRMLMNPKMKDMGLARFGKYWVQHFGTRMPPNTVRKKVIYREG